MSILNTAKQKISDKNYKNVFLNEDGAIDLASIMVGIIVIGLIGGVIAATVFAVIPWAQDNAAKQQLDAINTAEQAYAGMHNGVYADEDGLREVEPPIFDATNANAGIQAGNSQNNEEHYGAAVKSATGKMWIINDRDTRPRLSSETTLYDASFNAYLNK